jgi:hypothetical protein
LVDEPEWAKPCEGRDTDKGARCFGAQRVRVMGTRGLRVVNKVARMWRVERNQGQSWKRWRTKMRLKVGGGGVMRKGRRERARVSEEAAISRRRANRMGRLACRPTVPAPSFQTDDS